MEKNKKEIEVDGKTEDYKTAFRRRPETIKDLKKFHNINGKKEMSDVFSSVVADEIRNKLKTMIYDTMEEDENEQQSIS